LDIPRARGKFDNYCNPPSYYPSAATTRSTTAVEEEAYRGRNEVGEEEAGQGEMETDCRDVVVVGAAWKEEVDCEEMDCEEMDCEEIGEAMDDDEDNRCVDRSRTE